MNFKEYLQKAQEIVPNLDKIPVLTRDEAVKIVAIELFRRDIQKKDLSLSGVEVFIETRRSLIALSETGMTTLD